MSTLNLGLYILGALVTVGTAARFIGHWFGRVVGELVTQTTVFRELSTQQKMIMRAAIRTEKRQQDYHKQTMAAIQGLQPDKINGAQR
jgi:hypothetical protein